MAVKWSNLRLSIWLILILFTTGTLVWNLAGWLEQPFLELFLTIEGVLIAEMALIEILRLRESAEIRMLADIKGDDFGIQVHSMNKTLKDARVILNGVPYPWVDEEGKTKERRDIYVGEVPAARFVPFTIQAGKLTKEKMNDVPANTIGVWFSSADKKGAKAWLGQKGSAKVFSGPEEIGDRDATLYLITEKKTDRAFLSLEVIAPHNMPKGVLDVSPMRKFFEQSSMSIRIVAEGVEEVKDYALRLSPSELSFVDSKDGHALLGVGFELVEV